MRLRSSPAGTLLQSPGVPAATTTFKSNRDDGYLNPPLVASRTPEGLPWTSAALAGLVIGMEDADSNARPLMVTNVWAFAEFPVASEPPPPVPRSGPPDAGVSPGSDAGVSDAGTRQRDAGVNETDAGSDADGPRGPANDAVGCACDAEPGWSVLWLLLMLARRASRAWTGRTGGRT